MKLYHYIKKGNSALTEGILSFAKNPNADLSYYYKRSGASEHKDIVRWLESSLAGRSYGIRMFSEPIKWTENSLRLKDFIATADMFAVDLDAMAHDGLVEAVYVSPPVTDTNLPQDFCDELLIKLSGVEAIDFSPIDWSICNDALGRRFAFVRYYLIVVKGGVIPPQYIRLV